MENISLGERLKSYEKSYESTIEPEKHLILRIDGHHFSKYTKGFKKPFDSILSQSMIETTKDLVDRFNAYTGYTQSDEITLFLPSLKDLTVDNRKKKTHKIHKRIKEDWTHSFGGRVQKITSLVAAFTTMRFNQHLKTQLGLFQQEQGSNLYYDKELSKYSQLIFDKIGNAYFDCRVYGVPNNEEVFNSFMWRVRDAEKNSKSMFAQSFCSHKSLQGKSGLEQVEYCKEQTGFDWNIIEDKYKYGIFIKKELFMKETFYEDWGDVKGQRSRTVEQSLAFTSFSEENVKYVLAQYI